MRPVTRLRPSAMAPSSSRWASEIFSGRTPTRSLPPLVVGAEHRPPGSLSLAPPAVTTRSSPFFSATSASMRLEVPRKFATNVVFGFSYRSAGRAELFDPAAVHHRDRVGHRHGLLLVVGDVHEGDADLGLDALELQLHLAAQLEVEGAERLVEEQHLGVVDQRAGDGDALLLAAGELVRLALGEVAELHELQHVVDLLLHRLDAPPAQPEGDVLGDVQVREERVRLEDGVHRPLVRRQIGDVLVAEEDRAGGRLLKPGDHAERGGLATARRAEQGEERALRDGQFERVDGGEGAVRLADPGEADVAAGGAVCHGWGPRVLRGKGGTLIRGRAAQDPMSLENFCSYAVSSASLSERKEWDFAVIARSGRMSSFCASAGSILASSSRTPSTGHW